MQMWRCNVVMVLVLVGCSSFPKAPTYPRKSGVFSSAQEVKRPGIPNDQPIPMLLAPGDVLTIDLEADVPKTLTGVLVDGAGRVHLPMAGDIEVAGRGLTDAEGKIQAALRKFDRYVEVSIQVTLAAGQRATVFGAVGKQGIVQLDPGARVMDVIALAGGPSMGGGVTGAPAWLADLEGAVITRNGKPLPISVAKALEGDPLHNVFVHPGDHLYLPPLLGGNVVMLGQVGGPGVIPFRAGLRLTEALALSGGVTAGADKGDIRVIRGTLAKPRVYRASLSDFVAGRTHDVQLQAADIIFVTDHAIEDFGEVMSVVSSTLSLGFSTTALALAVKNY